MNLETYQLMTDSGWELKTVNKRKEWVHKNGYHLPHSTRKIAGIPYPVPYHASEQVKDHTVTGLTPAPFLDIQ